MGVGIIAQSHVGGVLVSYCDKRPYTSEVASAEALAMKKAVEICEERGWQRVILEGDSLEAIQHLLQTEEWWGSYGAVLQDVKQRLNNITDWKMEYVPRKANGVAHSVAKSALSLQGENWWEASYPLCIQPLVLAEQSYE